MRIVVVAPSCALDHGAARRVEELASKRGDCELVIDPQCFLSDGHFAGSDDHRLRALRDAMADPRVDALWFARGGYGSNRIAEAAAIDLPQAARSKQYMGYSDSGFLHSAFDKAGLRSVWGPMPQDVLRDGGEAAVSRALDWLAAGSADALEAGLDGPAMAYNLTVLSNLLGTPLEPDLSGMDLLLEDVGEHHYRLDRTMFHLTASDNVRSVRQIRLGRVSDIPANNPEFGAEDEEIVAYWCGRSGIAFGGSADIGHDSGNKVVPFRLARES